MIEPISVLLVDDNLEYVNLLSEYIKKLDDIMVAGIAKDGIEAVNMIKEVQPDVVILDIIMPNLDGIGVLEALSEIQSEKKPIYIMLTAVGQDIFIQKAIFLGAQYYIVKPFDTEILITRIRQIYRDKYTSITSGNEILKTDKKQDNTVSEKSLLIVSNIIQNIGIPPHLAGYQYIREAILISIVDSLANNFITKTLYPQIAVKYKTNTYKVERCIRMAINYAWNKGKLSQNRQIQTVGLISFDKKPSNSKFISTLSEKVRMLLISDKN